MPALRLLLYSLPLVELQLFDWEPENEERLNSSKESTNVIRSMGRLYIYPHFRMILMANYVGKYTIVPWILWEWFGLVAWISIFPIGWSCFRNWNPKTPGPKPPINHWLIKGILNNQKNIWTELNLIWWHQLRFLGAEVPLLWEPAFHFVSLQLPPSPMQWATALHPTQDS